MIQEIQSLGIKIAALICISPFFGYVFMKLGEKFEKAWRSNNPKQKLFATSCLFCVAAALAGWLR